MRQLFSFFSRFRKHKSDPTRPRTMAESQVEDIQGQQENTPERKVFDEKTFEKAQEGFKNSFGTSSHHADNPFREDDTKFHN